MWDEANLDSAGCRHGPAVMGVKSEQSIRLLRPAALDLLRIVHLPDGPVRPARKTGVRLAARLPGRPLQPDPSGSPEPRGMVSH